MEGRLHAADFFGYCGVMATGTAAVTQVFIECFFEGHDRFGFIEANGFIQPARFVVDAATAVRQYDITQASYPGRA